MPFPVPNLTDIYNRAISVINTELPGADANLKKSILNITALILAEMTRGEYGYLSDYILKQLFITTCSDENLEIYAAIRGLEKKAANYSSGSFALGGANGATILTGTQVQRLDGYQYTVTADCEIVAGAADVPIIANETGESGNADPTTIIQIISPPAGINSSGLVDSDGIKGGSNIETTDELRARLLAFIQNPPQGGAKSDYEAWTLEVPGVTRVFVNPLEFGLGTVAIRFLVEITDSNPNGIPTTDDINAVAAYIETKRPVTAKGIYVIAPIPIALDFNITLEVDAGVDVETNVTNELKAMLFRDSIPNGTIYTSRIIEAISLAKGEYACELNTPSSNTTYSGGEMAVLGAVVFV